MLLKSTIISAFVTLAPVSAYALQAAADTDAQTTTLSLEEDYSQQLQILEEVNRYNASLERQIVVQNQIIARKAADSGKVEGLKEQILDLTERMADHYTDFVENDLPFGLEERRARVARLQGVVGAADAEQNIAQNFRLLLEAYQIEIAAGREIAHETEDYLDESGQPVLDDDGKAEQTEFFRVGRVAFVKVNEKRNILQLWDQSQRQWVDLSSAYLPDIRQGLRVAKEEAAQDLISIPIPAPSSE